MDQNPALESLSSHHRIRGAARQRLVAGERDLLHFRYLVWVCRPDPHVEGCGVFALDRSNVKVVEEGVGSQHLSCNGVVPGVERHVLQAKMHMEVGLDHIGVGVESPIGNVDVQVAEIWAVVGETAWGSRRHVSVVLEVESDEKVFWLEGHHLDELAVDTGGRCHSISDDRGTDRRAVASKPGHRRKVGEAGSLSIHLRRGDNHHIALRRPQ